MQVTGQYLQLCSITSEQESKKSSGKRGERIVTAQQSLISSVIFFILG